MLIENNRQYIYSFPNASCTLRVIKLLRDKYQSCLDSVAVINLIDCWLIKLNLKDSGEVLTKNLQAFLDEMGILTQPSSKVLNALNSLETGRSPTEVMNHYHVVIVAHGKPVTEEIEIFRDRIVDRLGYCPQHMR